VAGARISKFLFVFRTPSPACRLRPHCPPVSPQENAVAYSVAFPVACLRRRGREARSQGRDREVGHDGLGAIALITGIVESVNNMLSFPYT